MEDHGGSERNGEKLKGRSFTWRVEDENDASGRTDIRGRRHRQLSVYDGNTIQVPPAAVNSIIGRPRSWRIHSLGPMLVM